MVLRRYRSERRPERKHADHQTVSASIPQNYGMRPEQKGVTLMPTMPTSILLPKWRAYSPSRVMIQVPFP